MIIELVDVAVGLVAILADVLALGRVYCSDVPIQIGHFGELLVALRAHSALLHPGFLTCAHVILVFRLTARDLLTAPGFPAHHFTFSLGFCFEGCRGG